MKKVVEQRSPENTAGTLEGKTDDEHTPDDSAPALELETNSGAGTSAYNREAQYTGSSKKNRISVDDMADESAQDTFDLYHCIDTPLPPPADSAALVDKMDFLHQQLDSFGRDLPVLGSLLLLGSGDNQRRQGGMRFASDHQYNTYFYSLATMRNGYATYLTRNSAARRFLHGNKLDSKARELKLPVNIRATSMI